MQSHASDQLPLDGLLDDSSETVDRIRVINDRVHRDLATFKSGTTRKIHRWFRLTPSFGPALVENVLDRLEYRSPEVLLDPFAGAGTTLIEGKLKSIPTLGFEVNPFLHFVANTNLNWALPVDSLLEEKGRIVEAYSNHISAVSLDTLEEFDLEIPPIHNPLRWWRADILPCLLLLKKLIAKCESEHVRNFFYLAFAASLIPDLTNVTLSRLQLHFIDRTNDDIRVLDTFVSKVDEMIADLEEVQDRSDVASSVILTDATKVSDTTTNVRADCVITSPPYPNRYSYVWNTRPFLYMLNFFDSPKEASALDEKTIGGTWGTATSVLANGIIPTADPCIAEEIGPLIESIRRSDNLMANYVTKYFNLLWNQISAMEHVLTSTPRLAYVVGCSRIKGVFVETDLILARLLRHLGYTVPHVHRFRKRNSGKDLHEAVVYAYK